MLQDLISAKLIVELLLAIGALFILSNLSYILLMASSFQVFKRNKSGWGFIKNSVKPISLIVPAHNEERNILESLNSFFKQEYSKFEIILVNDGSRDNTLGLVLKAYPSLEKVEFNPSQFKLCKTKIRGVYQDKKLNLTVIDKENGGKSDALNAGIDLSQYDYFCSVDADSIIDPQAFNKIIAEFNLNPALIACGASIRAANGSTIRHGLVEKESLPMKYLELCQTLEYTRSFMMGRVGWERFHATMIISGAFGVFSKKAVLEIDGFNVNSIGEDMDLIVRLHKHFLSKKNTEYKIGFIPEPLCWTEVPDSYQSLASQRNRWQRGLIASILTGTNILIQPGDTFFSKLSMPYYILTEVFAPILEIMSYVLIFLGVMIGIISIKIALLFFFVSVLFSMIISIVALIYEEIYFSKKMDRQKALELVLISFLENFGYRQFMAWQRIKGIVDYYRKKTEWGEIERHGLTSK